jgi:hypothetical protein
MRAKNSREIARDYALFAVGMCCVILTGLGCIVSFVTTSDREVARMIVRSDEYDVTFARQITLAERVDSLYNNIALLNSGQRLNEIVLQNRISTQKMGLVDMIDGMKQNDALLYGEMMAQVNAILQARDSIRLVGAQVELIKDDLRRCITDNRNATRKMIFATPTNGQ